MTDDGGGAGLDEDERAFLRRCAQRPDQVDLDELFDRIEAAESEERRLGARGLSQFVKAAPDRLAPHGDRLVSTLDHDDEAVRSAAITAVRTLVAGGHDAFETPPVEPLVARLGREDQQRSKQVARTLVDLLDADDPRLAEAVDETVDLFGGEAHEAGSAIQALAVLGEAFPEPVLDRLRDRLSDDDANVRTYAVRTVATLADDHPDLVAPATPDLLALLDDDDDYAREHALSTLAEIARTDPGRLDGAVPRLTGLVDAGHGKVRRGAVRTLAALGRADVDLSGAVDTLREHLNDPDKLVRRDAAYTLGILRAESALADLESLTDAGDLELQAVASAAVERIETGESDPPMADLEPGEIFVARNQRRT